MEVKLDKSEFLEFKKQILDKIDDLENRSRRNNLVFWNVPEGEEMAQAQHGLSPSGNLINMHKIGKIASVGFNS